MAKRKPYSDPVSATYVRDLRSKAVLGDNKALKELQDRNKALAKRANSALARLEKSGYTRYAYDRALSYTQTEFGMNRFTTAKDKLKWAEELQLNIQQMSKFLESKGSTITGAKDIEKRTLQNFRNQGVDIPTNREAEFLDFIASDEFNTLKKVHVDSGILMNDLADATQNHGVEISAVIKAFNKVANNQATYDIAMEEIGVII